MIVKTYLNVCVLLNWIKWDIVYASSVSLTVFLLYNPGNISGGSSLGNYGEVAFSPISVSLVSAGLSILLGFKTSIAYGRWWEARTAWTLLQNSARTLARLMITFADAKAHLPGFDAARAETWKKRQCHRVLAFVYTCRDQAIALPDWARYHSFGSVGRCCHSSVGRRRRRGCCCIATAAKAVPKGEEPGSMEDGRQASEPLATQWLLSEEALKLTTKVNKAHYILYLIARDVYVAVADGTLGGFDSFQMEGQMVGLASALSTIEKLVSTPVPSTHLFFNNVFLYTFITLLPFCTVNQYPKGREYMVVVVSVIISMAFACASKASDLLVNPFLGHISGAQDRGLNVAAIPVDALSSETERDVLELMDAPYTSIEPLRVLPTNRGMIW